MTQVLFKKMPSGCIKCTMTETLFETGGSVPEDANQEYCKSVFENAPQGTQRLLVKDKPV